VVFEGRGDQFMNGTATPEWGLEERSWIWAWSWLGSILLHVLLLVMFAVADLLYVPVLTIQERAPFDPRVVFMRPGRTYVPTDAEQESAEPVEDTPMFSERSTQAANPEISPEREMDVMPSMEGTQSRYLSGIDRRDGMLVLPGDVVIEAPEGAPPSDPVEEPRIPSEQEPLPQGLTGPELPVEAIAEEQVAEEGSYQEGQVPAEEAAAVTSARAAEESIEPVEPPETVSNPSEPSPLEPMPPGSVTSTGAVLPESRTQVEEIQVGQIGVSAFEVSQDAWGLYMKEVRERIGREWLRIVRLRWTGERIGEVTVHFELLPDGSIAQIRITKNTVGVVPGSWCVQAVESSAPFPPFPEEIRNDFNPKRQKIDFTFHY
jgi:hypothetical protein